MSAIGLAAGDDAGIQECTEHERRLDCIAERKSRNTVLAWIDLIKGLKQCHDVDVFLDDRQVSQQGQGIGQADPDDQCAPDARPIAARRCPSAETK
jgi:hypothetical protein